MILIADSGSTKTDWCLIDSGTGKTSFATTGGINPLYQQLDEIADILKQELLLHIPAGVSIHFYGAGCISPGMNTIVTEALNRAFQCSSVTIETDLMAAARSLCGTREGIACIMGTGSNSCYYDGQHIVRNISPLGYILGDEGSGAVLGKKLIAELLKNQLPETVTRRFFDQYALSAPLIVESVYKKPFPNRFLAQFTTFIAENLQEAAIQELVKTSFNEFFLRNIRQYPEASRLPVHFTGSIAYIFRNLLMEAAMNCGFKPGKITKSPMDGLVQYHLSK